MTTYYIDSNVTYASTAATAVTAKETPWGGAGGCQRAEHAVAAGDTIYYKSGTTIDVSLLKKFTWSASNGTPPVVGERVYEWSTGDVKGDAEGYVAAIDPGATPTYVWVEQTVATWGSTGKISNSAANTTNSWTYSGIELRGVVIQTEGTAGSPITRQGCANDAGWTLGTNVILNATGCVTVIDHHSHFYQTLKNITGYGAANGFHDISEYNWHERCVLHDISGAGFKVPGYGVNIDCIAYNCSRDGFTVYIRGTLIRPIVYGCGANYSGIKLIDHGLVVQDPLVFSNNGYGITLDSTNACCIRGGIINNNGMDGIHVKTAGVDNIVEFCRITNNGTAAGDWYGINADAAGQFVYENYNVFYNNDLGARLNVTAGANSINATSDAEVGYATAATNFALGSGAVLRRTSMARADGVNVQFVTAGLAPAPIPPPAGEVVLNGTAYEGATGAVAASGSRVDAAVGDVKAGVKYGDPDSQLTGELVAGGGVRRGGALRGA